MAQGAHHKPHQLPLHMSTWGKQAQPGTEGHSLMSLQRPGTSMEQTWLPEDLWGYWGMQVFGAPTYFHFSLEMKENGAQRLS